MRGLRGGSDIFLGRPVIDARVEQPDIAGMSKTPASFPVDRDNAPSPADDAPCSERASALDPLHYDAFAAALETPPAPGPKLIALLRRVPMWQK